MSGRKNAAARSRWGAAMDKLQVESSGLTTPDHHVGPSTSCSPRHRKITFARLATCVLNVERAFKRNVSTHGTSHCLLYTDVIPYFMWHVGLMASVINHFCKWSWNAVFIFIVSIHPGIIFWKQSSFIYYYCQYTCYYSCCCFLRAVGVGGRGWGGGGGGGVSHIMLSTIFHFQLSVFALKKG